MKEAKTKPDEHAEETSQAPSPTPTGSALGLPPLPPIPSKVPLSAETEQSWNECFEKVNQGIAGLLSAHPHFAIKPFDKATISKVFQRIVGGNEGKPLMPSLHQNSPREIADPLKIFWRRQDLQPIHFIRFLIEAGSFNPGDRYRRALLCNDSWLITLLPEYRRTHPEAGWREIGAAFKAAQLDPALIGRGLLGDFYQVPALQLPAAQTWPYWAEHLDLLEEAFAPSEGSWMERYERKASRANAFVALTSFPSPPERLVPLLWQLALGPKSERPQARRCLETIPVPQRVGVLTGSLAAGSAETRLAAAEWLGRMGDKSSTPALLQAFKKEKNEPAKGAIMIALELLGVEIDQFLNRAGLAKEAAKGLAKGIPEELKWFPFDQIPPVHWADNGQALEPEIVQWWLLQAFKLKNPEPGALLRRYCASLKAAEREALGQFILEAWITQDTIPISRAAAEKQARDYGNSMAQYAQYMTQHAAGTGQPPPQSMTAEQYYAQILPSLLKQPQGSATASKGILAVAGACVGGAAVPVVNRYLKEWYGQRAAQCRALLQMLSWVEHRSATQLLLAVGTRFRTKSIQEEANKQAEALADRKGWSVSELADRTIPSAGLDETGVITLDYGPRQFTARLTDDLDFVLSDSEGKVIKTLPDPRKDDDETKAAEAKKAYSASKKELKSVLTMQRDRLYEAMCTQRAWTFEDWSLYLNQHPIVKHLCRRLAWAVVDDGKTARLFRPLPDGSLTDVQDEPVSLSANETVRIAHECQVTPEQSAAWRAHFKDYDVEPLFEQFGRPAFDLSEERKHETEITDFQGHTVEAFKLRGRATKLGYTRGQTEDGGWFFTYRKRFPTLGIDCIIGFTGNALPEENRTVALTTLHFERVGEQDGASAGAPMLLSQVPAVLLGECWNDMRSIAAEGPGFDPDWEKRR